MAEVIGKETACRNVFVDTYVDYVLNKSVERVFDEFKRGFYKVCERSMVNLFQPEELRGVMLGSEDYDWDVLKKNATYVDGFYKEHPTIVLFWEVFEELSNQDKKAFLSLLKAPYPFRSAVFVTGFDRVPILGMGQGLVIRDGAIPKPGSDAAAQDALDGPSVEHGQDVGREMGFPQPPQEVEVLLGFLADGGGAE
ncbi:hypothetical protein QTP70_005751 [Hemibagrus guttatus]|uniref:HECT-type E3 ubiquitin transferase n=1 Tax=Hemibagrus guttatus TaxID=175788 RepID=A0AAE0RGX5_9TELE|nr:hypothetical protein QTP70_005751 [Hemibagrus guttatus]